MDSILGISADEAAISHFKIRLMLGCRESVLNSWTGASILLRLTLSSEPRARALVHEPPCLSTSLPVHERCTLSAMQPQSKLHKATKVFTNLPRFLLKTEQEYTVTDEK